MAALSVTLSTIASAWVTHVVVSLANAWRVSSFMRAMFGSASTAERAHDLTWVTAMRSMWLTSALWAAPRELMILVVACSRVGWLPSLIVVYAV
ncbi:hypothetical protein ACTG9Q_15665 [Actinokineospora sp. 24-640]